METVCCFTYTDKQAHGLDQQRRIETDEMLSYELATLRVNIRSVT